MKPHLHSYVWPRASNHTFIVTLWLAAGIPRAAFAPASRASNNGIRKRLYPYVRLRKVRVLIVPYIHASAVALSCAGIGALLLRCRELMCLRLAHMTSPASISSHRAANSPACHLPIRDFTNFRVSLQCERPPLTGLARIHLGNMKSLTQPSISAGSRTMVEQTSLTRPAHASRAPFWDVLQGGHFPREDGA